MSQYLHGFDLKEQKRLVDQAKFLESYVYSAVDFSKSKTLLEVGCGVGAQTQILRKKFPQLKITGVDLSEKQLQMAQQLLKSDIQNRKVQLFQQDAQKLNLTEGLPQSLSMNLAEPLKQTQSKRKQTQKFDSAFICWFLEHVPNPLQVLKRTKAHLKPGGKIVCSEVFNQTLFFNPYSPALNKYWFQFNDLQWTIKGHPFVGAELGNLLKAAGFKNVQLEVIPFHYDSRNPKKRAAFTEYFYDILLSAQKPLLESKRITITDLLLMKKEIQKVKKSKDAVFFYAFIQATASA